MQGETVILKPAVPSQGGTIVVNSAEGGTKALRRAVLRLAWRGKRAQARRRRSKQRPGATVALKRAVLRPDGITGGNRAEVCRRRAVQRPGGKIPLNPAEGGLCKG